jgi:ribosomal protein L16 Arg81 hydroxylase
MTTDTEGILMVPTDLIEVLQPCSVREFLTTDWGRNYRYIAGPADKFAGLLTWSRLNAVISEHRFVSPRLRLVKDRTLVPPADFFQCRQGEAGGEDARVDPVKLNDLLRQGATLVIRSIHEMVEPIARLAEEIERVVHEPVNVNAYASWGTVAGFGDDPHQDLHDVMVLQVAGRKHWKIYGPESEAPPSSNNGNGVAPPSAPLFDAILQPGEFLYLPRGWWHAAVAIAEPTLHLTVGCPQRTGADFLRWLHSELSAQPSFQQDLRRFASAEERREQTRQLRDELLAAWDDDALDRFFFMQDAVATPRPRFCFPWGATPAALPPTDEAQVRCTAPRAVTLRSAPGGDGIELWANGEKWLFARAAEPVLQPLLGGQPHSIAALCAKAADTLDREQVREFLGELLRTGLVAIVAVPDETAGVGREELTTR